MASQQDLDLAAEQAVRDGLPPLNIDLLEADLLQWIRKDDEMDKAAYAEIRASYVGSGGKRQRLPSI